MIRAVIEAVMFVVSTCGNVKACNVSAYGLVGVMKLCGSAGFLCGVYCARRTGSVVEAVACEGVVRCHDD